MSSVFEFDVRPGVWLKDTKKWASILDDFFHSPLREVKVKCKSPTNARTGYSSMYTTLKNHKMLYQVDIRTEFEYIILRKTELFQNGD